MANQTTELIAVPRSHCDSIAPASSTGSEPNPVAKANWPVNVARDSTSNVFVTESSTSCEPAALPAHGSILRGRLSSPLAVRGPGAGGDDDGVDDPDVLPAVEQREPRLPWDEEPIAGEE